MVFVQTPNSQYSINEDVQKQEEFLKQLLQRRFHTCMFGGHINHNSVCVRVSALEFLLCGGEKTLKQQLISGQSQLCTMVNLKCMRRDTLTRYYEAETVNTV